MGKEADLCLKGITMTDKTSDTPETDKVIVQLTRGEETDEQYQDHVDAMLLTSNSKDAEIVGSLISVSRSLERRLAAANAEGENLHAKLRETEAELLRLKNDRI